METTIKRHPVAQSLLDFIGDEATLVSTRSQETDTDTETASNIYRLICNWADARRDMMNAAEMISDHNERLKKQLIGGHRSDGASWLKDQVSNLHTASVKAEIYADQLFVELRRINLGDANIRVLFSMINEEAVTKGVNY